MRVYGDLRSGNCLKVKWTADLLGRPYAWQPVDIMAGDTRTADYLARFPMGQVPAIEFDDGRTLAQSNAIIRYLARGSRLIPADPFAEAEMDQWLFWEQYSHEPYIAVCRFHMLYQGKPKAAREDWRVARGEQALDLMERTLAGRQWFAGTDVSLADIALLAYTRVAPEGGFDLGGRKRVTDWIGRCEGALGIS
ncbi:MAG: glutathione S-transferase family protein [Hyphomicrobiaceae bacterium]